MIEKFDLIDKLKEILVLEEEFIMTYVNISEEYIEKLDDISDQDKKEMKDLIGKLYKDSERHEEVVRGILDEVKVGGSDEY